MVLKYKAGYVCSKTIAKLFTIYTENTMSTYIELAEGRLPNSYTFGGEVRLILAQNQQVVPNVVQVSKAVGVGAALATPIILATMCFFLFCFLMWSEKKRAHSFGAKCIKICDTCSLFFTILA